MMRRLVSILGWPCFVWIVISHGSAVATVPEDATQHGLPNGEAADVGMDPDRLADAASLVRRAVERDEIPNAVILVARDGKVILHEAYGWRDAEKTLPMRPDTLFRMASNSKAVTAAGILTLIDDRKLQLDDPLAKYLPAFDTPSSKSITIRHLLTHTAGLRINSLFLPPLGPEPTLISEVERFATIDPKVEPGTSYSYSNPGYNTLAAVIEKVTGSYKRHLRERLYEPLGMRDSCNHESDADPARMSTILRKTDNGWLAGWKPSDGPELPFARGSGGMVSSARDYAMFCQMFLDGGTARGQRILSEAVVREAINPQRDHIPAATNYGLGWVVSEPGDVFSHSGSDGTWVWVDPKRRLIGMLLTQSQQCTIPRQTFRILVERACTDETVDEPPLSKAEGYYKDIFMSGGVNLSSRKTLPAAESLGLSMEYYAGKDVARQNELLVGGPEDANGVLLYPDGQPRFRMLYVNGGSATLHGKSLTREGRDRLRVFHANGGSYCGSCAGSFLCGRNVDDREEPRLGYLHLFPHNTNNTGMKKARVGHRVPSDSPLARYRDFGPDGLIPDIYHNNGNWLPLDSGDHLADTEVLALYDNPGHKTHEGAAVWAYRKGTSSGRVVAIGSHPEGITMGSRLALTEAAFLYALDGNGKPRIKGTLQHNVPRVMDRSSEENQPDFARIGDRQYHHFRFEVPESQPRVRVVLDAPDWAEMNLYLRQDGLAFRSQARHRTTTKQLEVTLTPGTWHLGIECATTVRSVEDTAAGLYRYVGELRVLEGVPYTVTVSMSE